MPASAMGERLDEAAVFGGSGGSGRKIVSARVERRLGEVLVEECNLVQSY